MAFWSRLGRLFRPKKRAAERYPPQHAPSSGDPYGIWFYFRCNRCQAPIRVRVDRRTDLNPAEEGDPGTYVLHKDIMDTRCFQLIHAVLWFDRTFNLVASDIAGGTLISQAEYQAMTAPSPKSE